MGIESLIQAEMLKDGKNGGESTVVSLHCQQMREWGTRGGNVEFRPVQDDESDRRLVYLNKQAIHNNLAQRLDYAMDALTCRGEVLWYIAPDPENEGFYLIDFFVGGQNNPEPEYKVFYKEGGRQIERIIIRYSYQEERGMMPQKKWIRIVITRREIEYAETLVKPEFKNGGISPQSSKKYPNPFYPFLPVAISRNNARRLGQQGVDDFYPIKDLVEEHEQLTARAYKNLRMFASPILVTTRAAQEVMSREPGVANTWAAQNRYVDAGNTPYSGSTSPLDVPNFGMQRNYFNTSQVNTTGGALDTIFGNVGEGERFGFIQADAVSGDQNLWIRQLRELIHWCLGGVDPLGISASATFGEIKTLFGRVQNTADKKANALFGDTGLAKVLEYAIWREEQRFKEWLFLFLKQAFPQDTRQINLPQDLTDEICQDIWRLKQEGVLDAIPDQYQGILPLGDRAVTWRFTREVFQNTTREQLDRSIAARNEREDGLSQEWVLRKQYPNLTDQEIRNAMSGFSPRVVEAAAGSISILMQLFAQFMGIPDPQDPERPWALSLGLDQILEQAILTLRKEISYGAPTYEKADEYQPPTTLAESLSKIVNNVGDVNNVPSVPIWDSSNRPTTGTTTPRGSTLYDALAAADRLYRSGYTGT